MVHHTYIQVVCVRYYSPLYVSLANPHSSACKPVMLLMADLRVPIAHETDLDVWGCLFHTLSMPFPKLVVRGPGYSSKSAPYVCKFRHLYICIVVAQSTNTNYMTQRIASQFVKHHSTSISSSSITQPDADDAMYACPLAWLSTRCIGRVVKAGFDLGMERVICVLSSLWIGAGSGFGALTTMTINTN